MVWVDGTQGHSWGYGWCRLIRVLRGEMIISNKRRYEIIAVEPPACTGVAAIFSSSVQLCAGSRRRLSHLPASDDLRRHNRFNPRFHSHGGRRLAIQDCTKASTASRGWHAFAQHDAEGPVRCRGWFECSAADPKLLACVYTACRHPRRLPAFTSPAGVRAGCRRLRRLQDRVGRLLGNHNDRGVGVARHHGGHDRRIRHAQMLDTLHAQ